MGIERRGARSGRVNFPVIPAILVLGLAALIGIRQLMPHHSAASTEFVLASEDIKDTRIDASRDPNKSILVVHLTVDGSKRVAEWIAIKKTGDIQVAYGDRMMGHLKLGPSLDPTTLKFQSTPEEAITAKYAIGR